LTGYVTDITLRHSRIELLFLAHTRRACREAVSSRRRLCVSWNWTKISCQLCLLLRQCYRHGWRVARFKITATATVFPPPSALTAADFGRKTAE